MAFIGVPVVTMVTTNLCRITGVSLAADGDPSGDDEATIGLFGQGADLDLPEAFQPQDYDGVLLYEAIQFSWCVATANPGGVAPALSITKPFPPFLFRLSNDTDEDDETGEGPTGELEIWIRFH